MIYEGPGVAVPPTFLGMHCHRLIETHGGLPMVPSITAKIGRFRQWDAEGVNTWEGVHKALGRFDFSRWDLLMQRLPKGPDGRTIPVEWVLGQPPEFAIDRALHPEGTRYGFVPVKREALKEIVRAMLARYPNIKWIDVANEWDFGDNNGGSADQLAGFARGPVASLADAIRWTREAIDESGRKDVVLFLGSTTGAKHQLRLLERYPDLASKVDAFAFHAYDGTAENRLEPMGPRNGGIQHLRAMLAAKGIDKPIYDTEHGWMTSPDEGGPKSAKRAWDTLVFAALDGFHGLGFYAWDDSDGPLRRYTPFYNAAVREVLERFALEVQGKTIIKVVDPGGGLPWQVTTKEGPNPTAPSKPER